MNNPLSLIKYWTFLERNRKEENIMLHIVLNIWEYDNEVNKQSFALLLICNEDVSFASTVNLDIKEAWELATKLEQYLNKKNRSRS